MSHLVILCRYCETEIIQTHPNRKVCVDCKKEKNRKAQLKKYAKSPWYSPKKSIGNCVICGEQFFGTQNNKKVCGTVCKNTHRRIIQRSAKEYSKIKVNLFKNWVMWGERQ